jgi:hypothetical protein
MRIPNRGLCLVTLGVAGCLAMERPAGAQPDPRQPAPGIAVGPDTVTLANPLVIDATAPVPDPEAGSFAGGTGVAPDGQTVGVNSRYLLLNGRPWLPVMGEFHYTRCPDENWEEEILKMKAGGVQVVATYVFWIHHEEVEGRFDWTGRRDLRRFVTLCARHGMYVQLRIGPWDHGEVRRGGFPDWLVKRVPEAELRTNSEPYISYVRKFYDQVALQAKGLLWKDGGPVIGIQLENEYAGRGPHGGEEYIRQLKEMAIRSGFDVPFYMVTGWDNAVVPHGAVLPVFGGYMDAPWGGSRDELPASEVYAFRFGNRVTGGMGMMGAAGGPGGRPRPNLGDAPFLGAEFGGGMQVTYHRRPVIGADDVAALYPVMLGSGVNLYGTYMFHGGENPEGRLSTLQESQDTGYPNDVPVKSYDFQAPLGEFGQERLSFRKLKVFHYFLNDFGDRLAPLVTRAPEIRPAAPSDFSVPRLSARTNGRDGFIFFNNYVRYHRMPSWLGAQVAVKLPGETLEIPSKPITILSGAYFIWPFNLDVGGVLLKYGTAQLFTRVVTNGGETFFFVAVPGVEPEFVFDRGSAPVVESEAGRIATEADVIRVSGLAPALTPAVTVQARGGVPTRIILLSPEQAESAWKVDILHWEYLLLTPDQFYADGQEIHLQSIGDPVFHFQVTPSLTWDPKWKSPIQAEPGPAGAASYAAAVPAAILPVTVVPVKPAGMVPPVRMGKYVEWRHTSVAQSPEDADFAQAAQWRVSLPAHLPPGLAGVFLKVDYVGDVARLYSGSLLLEDDFFDGEAWWVGLGRFAPKWAAGPLDLEILPLRRDAPIFLEKRMRPDPFTGDQVVALRPLSLIPEYQISFGSDW